MKPRIYINLFLFFLKPTAPFPLPSTQCPSVLTIHYPPKSPIIGHLHFIHDFKIIDDPSQEHLLLSFTSVVRYSKP